MSLFRQPTPDCEWCEMPRGPDGCGPCREAFNAGRASMLAEVTGLARIARAITDKAGTDPALEHLLSGLAKVKP